MPQLSFNKLFFHRSLFIPYTVLWWSFFLYTSGLLFSILWFFLAGYTFWQLSGPSMICPSRTGSYYTQGCPLKIYEARKIVAHPLPEDWTQNFPSPSAFQRCFWKPPKSRKQGVRLYALHSFNPFLSNSSHNACRCLTQKKFTETLADLTFSPSPTPHSTDVEFPKSI